MTTMTMMKTGRQQQQQQWYQHHRPVRQSRDHLVDTPGSPWDPAMRGVFITGDTRTDNGPTASQGSVPSVTRSAYFMYNHLRSKQEAQLPLREQGVSFVLSSHHTLVTLVFF